MADYKKLFKKHPSVVSAYMFGSRARGDAAPVSDYDFAVQLDKSVQRGRFVDIKLKLINGLCRELKTDNVDVVVMNEAPLLLRHRILRDRKVLFCRSPLERIRNEAKILTAYLDEKPYEEQFAKGVFDSILGAN